MDNPPFHQPSSSRHFLPVHDSERNCFKELIKIFGTHKISITQCHHERVLGHMFETVADKSGAVNVHNPFSIARHFPKLVAAKAIFRAVNIFRLCCTPFHHLSDSLSHTKAAKAGWPREKVDQALDGLGLEKHFGRCSKELQIHVNSLISATHGEVVHARNASILEIEEGGSGPALGHVLVRCFKGVEGKAQQDLVRKQIHLVHLSVHQIIIRKRCVLSRM
mmetsp:Transcript_2568/g.4857  ORF Transcript_2568/g.4857 Transcript_2568/m.4857 type:complete len:221 (+) Transcript_2568:105-767(+)